MFTHTIDQKGRVSIPSKFRDALRALEDDRLLMTNFTLRDVPCIDVYPHRNWLRLEERVSSIPERDPDFTLFFNDYYVPGVEECSVDAHGRVIVPPRLREYARLGREVVLIGAVEKFRILNSEAYQPVYAAGEQVAREKAEALRRFGI